MSELPLVLAAKRGGEQRACNSAPFLFFSLLDCRHFLSQGSGSVAGVLDEPFSQLIQLSGVAEQAGPPFYIG